MMMFTIADKIALFTLLLYEVFLVNLHFKATMFLKLASFFPLYSYAKGINEVSKYFCIMSDQVCFLQF